MIDNGYFGKSGTAQISVKGRRIRGVGKVKTKRGGDNSKLK